MKNIPIGLQLFSVRKAMEKDYWGTLEKVAKIGYKYAEFAIFPYNDGTFNPEMSAKELRKRLNDIGLDVINTMVAHHEKLDWDRVTDYCKELGNIGFSSPIFFYPNKDALFKNAEFINNLAEMSNQKGLEYYFHNHFMEFQKFDGKYAFDIILENTDPSNVLIELDTFWAQRGGMDPIEIMDRVSKSNRLRLIHQKDISHKAKPVNLLEVVPDGTSITYDVFWPLGSSVLDFAEVGTGIMDVKGIVKKAQEIDSIKYIIVEQDQTTLKELDSVKIGFDCLTKITQELQ